MVRVAPSLLLLSLLASACGHNPEQACVDLRVNYCRKLLECSYATGGAAYLRGCESSARRECVSVQCVGVDRPHYDPAAAEECPRAIAGLTCRELDRLGDKLPPPCPSICHA